MDCSPPATALPMRVSGHEYWHGFPSPEDLPVPGIEPASLMSPALAGRFFTTSATWEALYCLLSPVYYKRVQLKSSQMGETHRERHGRRKGGSMSFPGVSPSQQPLLVVNLEAP